MMNSEENTIHESCAKCGSKRQTLQSGKRAFVRAPVNYVNCLDCGAVGPDGDTRMTAIEFWDRDQKVGLEVLFEKT
jgi:hypothetical protein